MGGRNGQLHKISLHLLHSDFGEFYYTEVNVRNFEHHWFYAGWELEEAVWRVFVSLRLRAIFHRLLKETMLQTAFPYNRVYYLALTEAYISITCMYTLDMREYGQGNGAVVH